MKRLIYLLGLMILIAGCKETPEPDGVNEWTSDTESSVHSEHADEIEEHAEDEKNKMISFKDRKRDLEEKGYQIFEMVDESSGDTILMQQYFIAFLKSGPIRNQNEEESKRLQEEHLAHLSKMYELGYADISGPFGDDGDIRGMTVYNTPTIEMADSLANADPAVKAQRLVIEIRPWWAMKDAKLR